MIKKYKQFNEGITQYLKGPSENELWDNIKDETPDKILMISTKADYLKGIKYALEHDANYLQNKKTFDKAKEILNLSDEEILNKMKKYNVESIMNLSSNVDFLFGVKYAVSKGIKINDYVISTCATSGYNDILLYAIKQGCNIEFKNNIHFSPLFLAVHNNHYETAKLLLNNGADVNAFKHDMSILDSAIKIGNIDMINLIKNYLDK